MSGAATGSGRSALVRGGLGILSVQALVVGLWALFLPRSFYEDFPSAGREWVCASGPYNGHLLADVGAKYLALGVLLAVAAVSLGRDLVSASLATWPVCAVPHLVYHAATLHHHELAIDRLGNLVNLGFVVPLPLVLLLLDGLRRAVDGRQAEGVRGG
jgi:hypothetical protein